jgi:hypothetical protein
MSLVILATSSRWSRYRRCSPALAAPEVLFNPILHMCFQFLNLIDVPEGLVNHILRRCFQFLKPSEVLEGEINPVTICCQILSPGCSRVFS